MSGKTFDVVNPSDATVIAKVAEGDAADVDAAVDAAQKAFDTVWGEKCDPVRRFLIKAFATLGWTLLTYELSVYTGVSQQDDASSCRCH